MISSRYKLHRFLDGHRVRLKTLEEVCKLEGVEDRRKIKRPYITSQMIELFGSEVVVDNALKPSQNPYFRAKKPGASTTWVFHFDWIEDGGFKTELIPDELFEI